MFGNVCACESALLTEYQRLFLQMFYIILLYEIYKTCTNRTCTHALTYGEVTLSEHCVIFVSQFLSQRRTVIIILLTIVVNDELQQHRVLAFYQHLIFPASCGSQSREQEWNGGVSSKTGSFGRRAL